jgi:hypothetical protein
MAGDGASCRRIRALQLHAGGGARELGLCVSTLASPRLAVAIVIRGQMVGHLLGDAAARYQPTLLAAAKAGRDPQVDVLLRARADEHEVGKVWHSVRLDLAPLEVVTAN